MREMLENLKKEIGPRPNPVDTWEELDGWLSMDEDAMGSSYVWTVRNRFGQRHEVYRINPMDVILEKEDGKPDCYKVRCADGGNTTITENDIMRGSCQFSN